MPPTISEEELKDLNEAKAERDRLKAEKITPKPKGDDQDEDDDEDDDKKKKKSKGKKSEADDEDQDEDTDEDDDKESLRDKAKKNRDEIVRRSAETKILEKALKFNFSVGEFVKSNSELLPSEIPEILKAAEKETYDSEVEKACAVKTGFIQSFFAVQSNVDLLTTNQKSVWDDYLKLTVNGKEQKAAEIYENLFEPAFETLRKVKKAEDVGKSRSGFAKSTKVEDLYKERLIAGSKKTYLGEKGDK